MIIFESGSKINFVDNENKFVGFDIYESCCEDFGYFFCKELPSEIEYDMVKKFPLPDKEVLNEFNFDRNFKQEIKAQDEGGAVAFKLRNIKEELFLVLYNHHNGYYSHGFVFMGDYSKIFEGSL